MNYIFVFRLIIVNISRNMTPFISAHSSKFDYIAHVPFTNAIYAVTEQVNWLQYERSTLASLPEAKFERILNQ